MDNDTPPQRMAYRRHRSGAWLVHDCARYPRPTRPRGIGKDAQLLTDRVLVHRGEPQRYGSQFDVIDGRLVPARIANLADLDQRRKTMDLPPMAEYVRMLGDVYKLPVVWPPTP